MFHGSSEMTPTLPVQFITSDHLSLANKPLKVPSHYYRYTSNNRLPSSSSMVTVIAGGLSVICESDVLS